MKSNKAIIITIVVIAMAAVTIVITWLGANLPNTEENGYIEEDYMYQEQPPEEEAYFAYDEDEDIDEAREDKMNEIEVIEEEYLEEEALEEYEFIPIFTMEPLPDHIIAQITGVTFHDNTPFGYDFLTYLTVTHVNFNGESVIGHLIVAAEIGTEVLEIFQEIYEAAFPIHSIRLIDYFGASDYESMAANNSHAFNFRYIAGTNVISRHGFGMAIDINPIQNPYYRHGVIWPAAGEPYLDRSYIRPGMIIPGDAVYTAFIGRGWIWGGNWTSPRDYHHFERRN